MHNFRSGRRSTPTTGTSTAGGGARACARRGPGARRAEYLKAQCHIKYSAG